MNTVSSNQSGVSIQLSLFDAIKDLLFVHPVFLIGAAIIGIILIIIFRKNRTIPRIRTTILCLLFYYYLCIMLTHVVGIPTLGEYERLSRLGESFFNPNINLIPLHEGFSLGFILNILLFIPLGFLCPLLSRRFQRIKNTLFLGFGLSFTIEILQLFTLYRATDIDDLITNTLGALAGYLCFRFVQRLGRRKSRNLSDCGEPDGIWYMPVVIVVITFIFGFFS